MWHERGMQRDLKKNELFELIGYCKSINKFLFATTLFREIPELNWFATTILRDHVRFIHTFSYDKPLFAAINIRDVMVRDSGEYLSDAQKRFTSNS